MQTAASLPVVFLGLPAGATADMFDRRRLLIFWQAWMLATVAILSALTMFGVISPATLLVLTFLLNIGSAMNNPAWQAIVPELVPRAELPDAIALNSAGFNLARAVGPALGGLMVAAFTSPQVGAAVVFLLNSASFLAVIFVLYVWKRTPLFKSALPSERIFGSMRSGVRYVRHSPPLRAILLRALLVHRFRQRGVGAACGSRAAGTSRRRDGVRTDERLPGHRRRDRRIPAAALAPDAARRVDARRNGPGLRRHAGESRAYPQHPADCPRAGCRRMRLDHHHVDIEYRGAGFRARMGAGTRAGHLPDGLRRRNGRRQRALGVDRGTSREPDRRCWRPPPEC